MKKKNNNNNSNRKSNNIKINYKLSSAIFNFK